MRIPKKKLVLPSLPFPLNSLEPVISSKALKIHYIGHHKSYIKKFNHLLTSGGKREDLLFNYYGHVLHSLYWENLSNYGSSLLDGPIYAQIKKQFGSEKAFYKKLLGKANSLKGSGWTLLLRDKKSKKLTIKNISNHNVEEVSGLKPLLVIDVWEHSYYLDYQNRKTTFLENFTYIINWDKVNERFGS